MLESHQDLAALEQMGDGFLDFRHRINRGDGNDSAPEATRGAASICAGRIFDI